MFFKRKERKDFFNIVLHIFRSQRRFTQLRLQSLLILHFPKIENFK